MKKSPYQTMRLLPEGRNDRIRMEKTDATQDLTHRFADRAHDR